MKIWVVNRLNIGVFPIIAPQLSGHVTYSPPNNGNYTIMGGYIFMGGGYNGKDPNIVYRKKFSIEFLRIVPKIVLIVVSDKW